jgi:hypothetical protein
MLLTTPFITAITIGATVAITTSLAAGHCFALLGSCLNQEGAIKCCTWAFLALFPLPNMSRNPIFSQREQRIDWPLYHYEMHKRLLELFRDVF